MEKSIRFYAGCVLLISLLSFACEVVRAGDSEALMKFKERITHDPFNVLASWDPTLVDPCTWFHVTCNANNRVIRLDLANEGLSGTLAPELGNLDALQYLELDRNSFTGPIPAELGNLSSLIALDLWENQLNGSIPYHFDQFTQGSLRFIVHNIMSFGRLGSPYLATRLDTNKLSGTLTPVLGLIDLFSFNVSNNDLRGFVSTTFSRYDITSFKPGNPGLCGGRPINVPCPNH